MRPPVQRADTLSEILTVTTRPSAPLPGPARPANAPDASIHWHEGSIDWRFESRRATEDFLARVTYTNEDTVVELLQ